MREQNEFFDPTFIHLIPVLFNTLFNGLMILF